MFTELCYRCKSELLTPSPEGVLFYTLYKKTFGRFAAMSDLFGAEYTCTDEPDGVNVCPKCMEKDEIFLRQKIRTYDLLEIEDRVKIYKNKLSYLHIDRYEREL